jgi:PTH1 family peptidyl-tRNA hydrolase
MWLVVGLGNPGEKYARTRHNVGFMVVDALVQKLHGNFQSGFKGEVAKGQVDDQPVVFLKPQTFMNLSGESVQPASHFHKIPSDRIIVVHDELDLPFGAVRVKVDGGHGGHNGIRDITRAMGAAFVRVRVGVGRPQFKGSEADYVLNDYRPDEKVALAEQIQLASDAVLCVIRESAEKAQMLFNQKKSPLANKV